MVKITLALTEGQLKSIAKQLNGRTSDSVAVEVEVVEAPTPTPSKTAPVWQSKIAKKANPAEYKAANVHGNKVINHHVGEARKALKAGDEKALASSLKGAYAVCSARIEAGALAFETLKDGIEGRVVAKA